MPHGEVTSGKTGSETPPLISVVMTAYNHASYVEETIQSVWDQTYPNLEIVVVDDASTDRTYDILTRLQSKSPVPMRVERNFVNVGPNVTQKRSVSLARGEWIALLAGDDPLLPGRFETQAAVLSSRPEVQIVYANGLRLERGTLGPRVHGDLALGLLAKSPQEVLEYLYTHKGPFFLQTALLRRSLYEASGGNDEAMLADDMVLNIRFFQYLVQTGGTFAYVDQDVVIYRVGESNFHRNFLRQSRAKVQVFKKYTPKPWRARAIGESYWHDALQARRLGLPLLSLKYFLFSQRYWFCPRRWGEFVRGWMGQWLSRSTSESPRPLEAPRPIQAARPVIISDRDLKEINQMLDWHAGSWLDGRLLGRLARKPGKRVGPEPIPDPRIIKLHNRLDLQGKSVLEVGCFEGLHTVGLRMYTDRVTAIDVRPVNVVKTLARLSCYGYSAEVFVKDAETLDRTFGTFDLIFHCGVLYHLVEPVSHLLALGTMTTHLFLDTHVARDEKHLEDRVWNGQSYRGAYHDEGGWADPFSGKDARGFWLTWESLQEALRRAGFSSIDWIEEREERNGPRVALLASR